MKTKSTELAKKLAERIKKEFDIDVNPVIHKTYVGYWQKAAGGWLWFMFGTNNDRDVGSCFKAKDVLKAKKLSLYSETGQHEILIEKD